MTEDFEALSAVEQRAELKHLYMRRDQGVGSNVRFMDDLEMMFVSEDCGGDLNFVVYSTEGEKSFVSLGPKEVFRLYKVLEDRVRDYPASVKGDVIDPFQVRVMSNPQPRPW